MDLQTAVIAFVIGVGSVYIAKQIKKSLCEHKEFKVSNIEKPEYSDNYLVGTGICENCGHEFPAIAMVKKKSTVSDFKSSESTNGETNNNESTNSVSNDSETNSILKNFEITENWRAQHILRAA